MTERLRLERLSQARSRGLTGRMQDKFVLASLAPLMKAVTQKIQGLMVRIEYKAGEYKPIKRDTDSPFDDNGFFLYADYGFIENTVSNEFGEELDVFVGPDRDSPRVFIGQLSNSEPGNEVLMEEKVLLGFKNHQAARGFFDSQYWAYQIIDVYESDLEDLRQRVELNSARHSRDINKRAEEDRQGIAQEPRPLTIGPGSHSPGDIKY